MRLRASDIASRLSAGRMREWLRPGESREESGEQGTWLRSGRWEDMPDWLRSEWAREAWQNRPRWFRSRWARAAWEKRPEWLSAERARSAWERRPSWLRGKEWYEEAEAEDVLKGALAGAIGGLAGSWTMDKAAGLFQKFGAHRREAEKAEPAREYAQVRAGELESERAESHEAEAERGEWRSPQHHEEEEPATEKLAHTVSRRVLRRELSPRGKKIGGQVVHYGYGAAMGAIYGATAETLPQVTTGFGMPAGAAMWAIGDEVAVPALKLSRHPREYPLSKHATYLGMHLIYGATTELVRRTLRRMMD